MILDGKVSQLLIKQESFTLGGCYDTTVSVPLGETLFSVKFAAGR